MSLWHFLVNSCVVAADSSRRRLASCHVCHDNMRKGCFQTPSGLDIGACQCVSVSCSLTSPFLWLHMSQRGIRARVTCLPSSVGIWFCRVITDDTAHLFHTTSRKERKVENVSALHRKAVALLLCSYLIFFLYIKVSCMYVKLFSEDISHTFIHIVAAW